MEKIMWSTLAGIWMLVLTTATFGATEINRASNSASEAMAVVPVVDVSMSTPKRLLPTRILGEPSTADVVGLIIASAVCLRMVANRRAI